MSADYVCQIGPITSLGICLKNCNVSNMARLLDAASNLRYFRCPVLKTKSWQESKLAWKLKHGNSILESFEYFLQISWNSILIISSYTVSKLVPILRHSVYSSHPWTFEQLIRHSNSTYNTSFLLWTKFTVTLQCICAHFAIQCNQTERMSKSSSRPRWDGDSDFERRDREVFQDHTDR